MLAWQLRQKLKDGVVLALAMMLLAVLCLLQQRDQDK